MEFLHLKAIQEENAEKNGQKDGESPAQNAKQKRAKVQFNIDKGKS